MPVNTNKFMLMKPVALAILATLSLIGCQQSPDSDRAVVVDEPSVATPAESKVVATDTSPAVVAEPQDNRPAQIIEQPITILALGDSLTEGLGLAENDAYPAQLQQALVNAGYVNAKVINSGLSGETSTGLVNRLDWVLKTKPDITILTIGANDAMRGIDVATVEKNIRTAIEKLQSSGSEVVLGGMQIYDNLGDEYVQSFSDIYPKLATEYNVAFIPFFLEGVGGDPKLNQADAIHPTKEGYRKIVINNILPVLKPSLEAFVESQQEDVSL